MDISIYTNHISGGWSPIQKMLGASEGALVHLSQCMAYREHDVKIYTTLPDGVEGHCEYKIAYYPRADFKMSDQSDVLLTWKDSGPWLLGARGKVNLHWSASIEHSWTTGMLSRLDKFICLSRFHQSKIPWVNDDKMGIIPLGTPYFGKGALTKDHLPSDAVNNCIYTSSPDRGLETLLRDWSRILEHWPHAELTITYGWDVFDKVTQGNPAAQQFRQLIERLANHPSITWAGAVTSEEYWKLLCEASHWIYPLNNPNSELFCLSAVEAQYAGCWPVVLHADDSGLSDTVDDYIDYNDFVNGKTEVQEKEALAPAMGWDEVFERYWQPLLVEG